MTLVTRIPLLLVPVVFIGLFSTHTVNAGDRHLRSIPRSPPSRFHREVRHHHARECEPAVRCTCRRHFEAGHYETVCDTIVVPGYYEKVWVPACYEARVRLGCRISVQIGGGYYKKVWHPAREERIERRVWVEGRWITSGTCGLHPRERSCVRQ